MLFSNFDDCMSSPTPLEDYNAKYALKNNFPTLWGISLSDLPDETGMSFSRVFDL